MSNAIVVDIVIIIFHIFKFIFVDTFYQINYANLILH